MEPNELASLDIVGSIGISLWFSLDKAAMDALGYGQRRINLLEKTSFDESNLRYKVFIDTLCPAPPKTVSPTAFPTLIGGGGKVPTIGSPAGPTFQVNPVPVPVTMQTNQPTAHPTRFPVIVSTLAPGSPIGPIGGGGIGGVPFGSRKRAGLVGGTPISLIESGALSAVDGTSGDGSAAQPTQVELNFAQTYAGGDRYRIGTTQDALQFESTGALKPPMLDNSHLGTVWENTDVTDGCHAKITVQFGVQF